MTKNDKVAFSFLMMTCFQNFLSVATDELVDMWFKKLIDFEMEDVRNAFDKYIVETERFPPTLGIIIKFAKEFACDRYLKIEDEKTLRCCVEGCEANEEEIVRCGYNNLLMCQLHDDEVTLEVDPDSPRAELIRNIRTNENRKFTEEEKTKTLEEIKNLVDRLNVGGNKEDVRE